MRGRGETSGGQGRGAQRGDVAKGYGGAGRLAIPLVSGAVAEWEKGAGSQARRYPPSHPPQPRSSALI